MNFAKSKKPAISLLLLLFITSTLNNCLIANCDACETQSNQPDPYSCHTCRQNFQKITRNEANTGRVYYTCQSKSQNAWLYIFLLMLFLMIGAFICFLILYYFFLRSQNGNPKEILTKPSSRQEVTITERNLFLETE